MDSVLCALGRAACEVVIGRIGLVHGRDERTPREIMKELGFPHR